ncbi:MULTISPECIES: site-2 protease family protein [Methanosphaera]|uniref:Conserved hypothetical membrane-spanning protein n=2 Tax=Methanosphaera stadtmanae TaxID=2317 RepID=Q2NF68_METST|nr:MULTISPECIES: site-2 protease family protein [Methanosphaera]ABC57535.1 conserved hypothetical membrane-spanning protein [Methanosphaera stadtmanae DSM 3091]MDO5822243.1 site-2 protease family protein [Methanosphaera sp.]MEE0489346.1 site-2 protease family protein [Methanosphaera stadtmanae]OEC89059.1 metalloprotease [Methanosphaera sp. A6]RAP46767.1 MAG: site-2 protease family protein [Methanosphaera sp. DEW79]
MLQFSKTETKDLSIAIIVITLLFAYLYSNGTFGMMIYLIPISLVTIGLSFILHELGHKYVAQKYGFFAEFRKWNTGLLIAIITGLFGFIFLAPGAVYIGSYTGIITDEENGKISIAGPIVNIILAVIFLLIEISLKPFFLLSSPLSTYLMITAMIGFHINSFLALFNLLPIPMLDGSKVMKWNLPLWIVSIVVAGLLTYASYSSILL